MNRDQYECKLRQRHTQFGAGDPLLPSLRRSDGPTCTHDEGEAVAAADPKNAVPATCDESDADRQSFDPCGKA